MGEKKSFPLSHPQKRIWLTELMNPGTGFANLAGLVTMPEPAVDLPILERAINLVIEQYDGLRLRLLKDSSYDLKQHFSPYEYRALELIKDDVNLWPLKKSREPLTLIDSDLYYFALFKNSDNGGGYYFKYHHIICDAMSVSLLNKEIYSRYRMLTTNQTQAPDMDRPSFIEFLDREQAYIDSEKYKEDENFWQSEFVQPLDPLAFHKKGQELTLATDRMVHRLDRSVTDKIHGFCRQHKTTIFRFFLSAIYVYLSSIYENKDLALNIGHHNRISKREKQMVGMTVSTLPVRVTLKEDMDFLAFLDQVTQKVALCLSHQAYPFDLLASHMRTNGLDPNHLMAVTVNQIPSLTDEYSVERYTPGADPAILNIKINPNQLPKGAPIELAIDYRLDFFTCEEVEDLTSRLSYLIDNILRNPKIPLGEIGIIPPEEKRTLLSQASGKHIGYNKEKLVHQLLEEEANRCPDRVALSYEDAEYTYADLNEKTNQLARVLRKRGLKPDNFVAIMMERSCDYVFALIATLKAGGAFVPIDPSLPDQRIKLILKECRPVLLLTHSALRSRASSLTDNWLNIDRANIFTGDKGPLDNRNSLSDIAYIIYTSGSSGKPKGVMNTHGNLLNFCQWSKDFYQLEEGDSHAAYCNFAFDVSIAELVPPLMVGSSLHIIPEGIRLSIPAINKYFKKHRITVATFPTRVGELFIQEDNKSLRILTLVGEKFNRFKGQNYCMVNAYGPTEATIYATAYKIDGDSDNIPIGLPLANTWAYVVDKKGRLLPKGLAGELWLSGPHIARGYLNDPEQTGQVFISNPYRTGDENPIVYKSGDLVRHRGDGNLEFLSRLDQQVKLRGHRIETSEIEKHLLAHKSVKKAVVTKTKLSNTSSLCAYIEGDKGLDLDQVQDELKVTLPPYMVPDYFKQVAYIPMTPNGKIDYDRLNASLRGVIPKKRQANKEAKPKTPTQIKLATIWKDVLNIPQVNCSDTFFDLGGDSLSVMVLSVRIEESFKLDIPPHLLYKESTIKKQSALIEGRVNNDRAFVVELAGNLHASEQAKRPIFCIHDITGELLSYAHLADSLGETYPVYGIRGQKKNTAKELSLEDLVASYIDGIKAIQPTGPYSLVGYSSGGMLAFEMAKQLHQKGDRLSLLALVDTPNYAKYPARNIYLMALRNVLPWLKDIPLKNLPPLACFTIKKVLQVLFKPNNYSPAKIKTAINRYLPEPYPGRLVLFRTNWRAGEKDQSLGWDGIAQLGLDLIHTEGNHISVMNITNSKQLAKKIIEILGDE